MAQLVQPDPRFHHSYVRAAEELLDSSDDDHYAGLTVIPPFGDFPGESYTIAQLRDAGIFAAYVTRIIGAGDPGADLPRGIVPATFLWWVEGDDYLGRLSIRHSLTPWLLDFGGHIGYVVRPSARRQGHASAMLRAALPVAADMGINPALVTCDDTNVGSRRVIELAGGVFDDQRGQKLRFWVPTTSKPDLKR